jgi:peroxiredoxin
MHRYICTIFAILALAWPAMGQPAQPGAAEIFRLEDHLRKSWALADFADHKAVVLITHGVGCPIVRQLTAEVERLRDDYAKKEVAFFWLNANRQDTREDIAEEAAEYEVTVPVLVDETQRITHSLGCPRTAEALVIDPKNGWRIVYRGAIDDRFDYGAEKPEVKQAWLRDALDAHLAGEAIATAKTETKGCLIAYKSYEEVSYAHDIAPIIEQKCFTCHHRGGVGPFALSSFRRVDGWSEMIREVVRTKRMPPWHADRASGPFQGDRGLTVEEEAKLLAWIENGAQRGEDEPDPLAAVTPPEKGVWSLGEPDLVVQLREPIEVPAEGVIDYQYITVSTGLTEDKWVRAWEVLPTDETVVHHALVFVLYPKEYRHIQPNTQGGLEGFFASYLPGGDVVPLDPGVGQFLPAGSALTFQMHYTTTGRATTDQTRMGLWFHDAPPANALDIKAAHETDFLIPAHAKDYEVEAWFEFERPATLLGVSPHMHYRGSRFNFHIHQSGGGEVTLLNVPFYEFDWQPMYIFPEPLEIPAGAKIHCVGAFDNTKFNPRNPDPGKAVEFGIQSWEEMFIGYLGISRPRDDARYAPRTVNPGDYVGQGEAITAEALPGQVWRFGRRIEFEFEDNGRVSGAEGRLRGLWTIEGDLVRIKTIIDNVDLTIFHDELLHHGRPLQRVK